MKIGCQCGASIIDQTDDLPHKGHLISDQEWFATLDAIDDEVIDPVADGRLGKEAAYRRAREVISRSVRLMWQCGACGRLYIDGLDGQLRCFVLDGNPADREVLRSRPGHAESGGLPDPGRT
jgi:hypothetical protein